MTYCCPADVLRVRIYVLALRQRWLYENQTMSLYFYQLEERRESIKYMLKWFTCRKIRIKSVNVLNDCFHVWYSGPFATINGFRLGRHPLTKVDWNEVNAALGEITLLLVSVGFNFTRYILVPQGSHSKLKSGAPCVLVVRVHTSTSWWFPTTVPFVHRWELFFVA